MSQIRQLQSSDKRSSVKEITFLENTKCIRERKIGVGEHIMTSDLKY